MDLKEFEIIFEQNCGGKKTKAVDSFNKKLIRQKTDVSFLNDIVMEKQEYHRTYFQVSLGLIDKIEDKLAFIENNCHLLNDWWHVDQLSQFVDKYLKFDYVYAKAKEYINHSHPFMRRWGYVIFMPSLVKDADRAGDIIKLFKDDEEYYVQMAEAWLISYLGIYAPEVALDYLKTCPLKYNIAGKGIQKICDSFRVSDEWKKRFKEVRRLYK